MRIERCALAGLVMLLAACASTPGRPPATTVGAAGTPPGGVVTGSRYYLDDGPGSGPAVDPASVPDAVPRREPLSPRANRPYQVFERTYVPLTELQPFRERGVATWYGRRYHGQRTSSGEVYDMYAMTAAHPTLPIPSFARVTAVRDGRSVVVRVNDRGPFVPGRIIDLSWTAAARLGYVQAGSAEVEVELILPGMPPGDVAGAPLVAPVALPGAVAGVAAVPPEDAGPLRLDFTVESAGGVAAATAPAAPVAASASVAAVAPAPAPAPALPATPPTARPSSLDSDRTTAVAPAAAKAPVSASVGVPLHWVQLGAYSNAAAAESALRSLAVRLGWPRDRLSLRAEGGRHRVLAGPWRDREDALAAVKSLRRAGDLQPFIVSR